MVIGVCPFSLLLGTDGGGGGGVKRDFKSIRRICSINKSVRHKAEEIKK